MYSYDLIAYILKQYNRLLIAYSNVCSRHDPPHRHPLDQRCSQARIAAVRATLDTLLQTPQRVHRRRNGGRFPSCKCRTESTIESLGRPPSMAPSGQNFSRIGSTLYSSCVIEIIDD